MIADVRTEARVVFALLTEPFAFPLCADLGLPDVTDFRLRVIMTAIRNLPNHREDVTLDAVMAHVSTQTEQLDWAWLGQKLAAWPPYNGETVLLEHDLAWLRKLSERRAESEAA